MQASDRTWQSNFIRRWYFTETVEYCPLVKYDASMSWAERTVSALEGAFRSEVRARRVNGPHRDVIVSLDGAEFLVRWLTTGWPRQVAEALHATSRPDILAAPTMSPGARKAAHDAGVGWVDESGAADIHYRNTSTGTTLVIETKGAPPAPLDARIGWRRATLAVCEALLANIAGPTVASVVEATGLSMGSSAQALKFLEKNGHLASATARGPKSARLIVDRDALLDAYAEAADKLRSPISISTGVLWRDPTAGVVKAGQLWDAAGIEWAATSALSASLLAPMQTEIAPMEIYVPGRSWSDLRRAAMAAGLQEIAGGRLILRFFPTPACARLTEQNLQGFRSMLWPRVYADLRTAGVRGEDAAEHLREAMTK
ncbi:hypothetical protein BHM02_18240 [Mycobacterium tuberculosis variant bovis]|uniref:hypothetical protein n=1 Tax=Mycobacterium tuberculosis TaxID=1773 RepID=UPI00084B17B6|nr:hypothetical protein [Mycobacterium tuberculosis]ODW04023.1 hypothetical protein BHM02_18240 [Mycobacterium tuberculosis variant bovis]WCR94341.1 hypothetical protein M1776_05595 [Mycobacterium tuberculosis variant bovis]